MCMYLSYFNNKNLRLLSGALQMLLWASLGADKWRHFRPGVSPGFAEEEGDSPGGHHSLVEFQHHHIHFLVVYRDLCPTDPWKSEQNIDGCFSLAQNPLGGKKSSKSSSSHFPLEN